MLTEGPKGWHARNGDGNHGDDAQQQMLSKTDSGRCWAGDVLSQMDNIRGDADSESS